jgi:hypothetical protein
MAAMEHQPTGQADEQADDGSPVEVTTTYLDLDGDGVIDAVQMVEVAAVDVTGDGTADVVEVVEELAAGIGVDGVPDQVTVIEDGQVSVGGED